MAKRILKGGTRTFRASCGNCGCLFTYEMVDVHTNYLRGGEWVSCPQCHHQHMHLGSEGTWQGRCST